MVEWGGESPTPNDRPRPERERKPSHRKPGKRIIAGQKIIVKGAHFCTSLCWDDFPWIEIRGAAFEEGRATLSREMVDELRGHIIVACDTLKERFPLR